MAISENKMKIVINNYFKTECSIDTTIRQAFEKGFRLGVEKAKSALKVDDSEVEYKKGCRNCKHGKYNDHWKTHFCYCPNDCNHWDRWEPQYKELERKTGKWIKDEFGSRCEKCGLYAYRDKFDRPWESDYCPNCGADMRGDDND